MSSHAKASQGPFFRAVRKVYNPIGFSKGYNFVLWFIFTGALMGFTLARFQFLNFNGRFCSVDPTYKGHQAAPGECFYWRQGHYTAGILLHLAAVLPASFLVCFQFVPFLRRKVMLFHRINGYVVIFLALVSTAGAIMVARRSFGGGIEVQAWIGLSSIMFVGSLLLAYINIKKLQIEQHRAWMLRAWFYAGSIITMRLILAAYMAILNNYSGYFATQPCDKITAMVGGPNITSRFYPDCATYLDGTSPQKHAAVLATMDAGPVEVAGLLQMGSGMALWMALAIHAVGIEAYLHLTPAEHERLRKVSYQRQLEAGMSKPGYAGLTNRDPENIKLETAHQDVAFPSTFAAPAITPAGHT